MSKVAFLALATLACAGHANEQRESSSYASGWEPTRSTRRGAPTAALAALLLAFDPVAAFHAGPNLLARPRIRRSQPRMEEEPMEVPESAPGIPEGRGVNFKINSDGSVQAWVTGVPGGDCYKYTEELNKVLEEKYGLKVVNQEDHKEIKMKPTSFQTDTENAADEEQVGASSSDEEGGW
mmetsp:Transcript_27155/g.49434  ORF Transcript_27155/g.49434 Transcript_27155/m.49434 type:complete len:180 (-) Transcript_27155:153-692(-)